MDLSVVIPSQGNWSRLKFTLDALANTSLTLPFDWEVLLVLDGVDFAPEFTSACPVRSMLLPKKRGRSAARNAGILAAQGKFVILLDEDVVVGSEFLSSHLAQQIQSPGLCHGPIRELPALVWLDDLTQPDVGGAVPKRIRDWASRVLRDLRDPALCYKKHGRPSRIERDGMEAFERGRNAVAWLAFAGANLSAPRQWFLDQGFDERPGTRWGLEDLSLALRWYLDGRALTVAADAWGLHLTHRRREWRESQRANMCCLDFVPTAVATAIVKYLDGESTVADLEAVLQPVMYQEFATDLSPQELLNRLEASGSSVRNRESSPRDCSEYVAEARLQARSWRQAGVRPGSLIVMEDLTGIPLFQAALAAWCCECVPMPCEEPYEQNFVGSTFKLRGQRIEQLQNGEPDERLRLTAILHRTSGSTGECRLARRSAATLLAEAHRYKVALSLTTNDRMLVVLPIYHSFGWGLLLGGLLAGCQVDLRQRFSPGRTVREMCLGRVSVLCLTPSMARLLIGRSGPKPIDPPRLVVVGAGPVDESLEADFETRFGVRLMRNYGSSETGATFSGAPGLPGGLVGLPMEGVTVLEPPLGGGGELVLEINPPVDGILDGTSSARWATGDLVERDARGLVRVLGRLDQKLRVNGKTLDRKRIETVLLDYPRLDEVHLLACPRPVAPEVEDLVAVVKGREISREELTRYCAEHLSPSHCPSRIVLCDELPRNQLGKLSLKKIVNWIEEAV